jgi:hypothetical protein
MTSEKSIMADVRGVELVGGWKKKDAPKESGSIGCGNEIRREKWGGMHQHLHSVRLSADMGRIDL